MSAAPCIACRLLCASEAVPLIALLVEAGRELDARTGRHRLQLKKVGVEGAGASKAGAKVMWQLAVNGRGQLARRSVKAGTLGSK